MKFELSATPELRVCQWVEQVTDRVPSCFEFGAGLFTYIKCAKSEKKGGCEWFGPYFMAVKEDPNCDGIEAIFEDMRRVETMPDGYEMALFVDSLEHLKKLEGLSVLKKCQKKYSKIAVFIPEGKHDNAIHDGNTMQAHLSTWISHDLEKLGFAVTVDPYFHHTNPPDKQSAMFAVWTK